MNMALYLSFLNLISGTPSVIDRLTTAFRRNRNRRPRRTWLSESGQAPPRQSNGRRRFRHDLWRYRIQSVRLVDLSPHLRRDIGLDS
jgi:hypothetical protein